MKIPTEEEIFLRYVETSSIFWLKLLKRAYEEALGTDDHIHVVKKLHAILKEIEKRRNELKEEK